MGLGKVLWKAIDGREFIIDTNKLKINSIEELNNHIAELRKEHGYEQPDLNKNNMVSHAFAMTPEVEQKLKKHKGVIDIKDLPEDLKKDLEKELIEAFNKPDPKKLD
jgi:hypothetical protein